MRKREVPSFLMSYPNTVQVRASSILAYYSRSGRKSAKSILSQLGKSSTNGKIESVRSENDSSYDQSDINEVRKQAYSGQISKGAKRRLRKVLELFAMSEEPRYILNPYSGKYFKFHLAFVTLTLPVSLSDSFESEASAKLLKPFIQSLQRTHRVKNYCWRLERTKKGRYHYHMVIDQPVHMKHIQNSWNRLLRVNRLLDNYAAEHGHYNAPSTEIKAIRDSSKSLKYMSKYLSKPNEQMSKVKGRLWDAAKFLKQLKFPVLEDARILVYEMLCDIPEGYDWTYFGSHWLMFELNMLGIGSNIPSFHSDQVKEFRQRLRGVFRSEPDELIEPIESVSVSKPLVFVQSQIGFGRYANM